MERTMASLQKTIYRPHYFIIILLLVGTLIPCNCLSADNETFSEVYGSMYNTVDYWSSVFMTEKSEVLHTSSMEMAELNPATTLTTEGLLSEMSISEVYYSSFGFQYSTVEHTSSMDIYETSFDSMQDKQSILSSSTETYSLTVSMVMTEASTKTVTSEVVTSMVEDVFDTVFSTIEEDSFVLLTSMDSVVMDMTASIQSTIIPTTLPLVYEESTYLYETVVTEIDTSEWSTAFVTQTAFTDDAILATVAEQSSYLYETVVTEIDSSEWSTEFVTQSAFTDDVILATVAEQSSYLYETVVTEIDSSEWSTEFVTQSAFTDDVILATVAEQSSYLYETVVTEIDSSEWSTEFVTQSAFTDDVILATVAEQSSYLYETVVTEIDSSEWNTEFVTQSAFTDVTLATVAVQSSYLYETVVTEIDSSEWSTAFATQSAFTDDDAILGTVAEQSSYLYETVVTEIDSSEWSTEFVTQSAFTDDDAILGTVAEQSSYLYETVVTEIESSEWSTVFATQSAFTDDAILGTVAEQSSYLYETAVTEIESSEWSTVFATQSAFTDDSFLATTVETSYVSESVDVPLSSIATPPLIVESHWSTIQESDMLSDFTETRWDTELISIEITSITEYFESFTVDVNETLISTIQLASFMTSATTSLQSDIPAELTSIVDFPDISTYFLELSDGLPPTPSTLDFESSDLVYDSASFYSTDVIEVTTVFEDYLFTSSEFLEADETTSFVLFSTITISEIAPSVETQSIEPGISPSILTTEDMSFVTESLVISEDLQTIYSSLISEYDQYSTEVLTLGPSEVMSTPELTSMPMLSDTLILPGTASIDTTGDFSFITEISEMLSEFILQSSLISEDLETIFSSLFTENAYLTEVLTLEPSDIIPTPELTYMSVLSNTLALQSSTTFVGTVNLTQYSNVPLPTFTITDSLIYDESSTFVEVTTINEFDGTTITPSDFSSSPFTSIDLSVELPQISSLQVISSSYMFSGTDGILEPSQSVSVSGSEISSDIYETVLSTEMYPSLSSSQYWDEDSLSSVLPTSQMTLTTTSNLQTESIDWDESLFTQVESSAYSFLDLSTLLSSELSSFSMMYTSEYSDPSLAMSSAYAFPDLSTLVSSELNSFSMMYTSEYASSSLASSSSLSQLISTSVYPTESLKSENVEMTSTALPEVVSAITLTEGFSQSSIGGSLSIPASNPFLSSTSSRSASTASMTSIQEIASMYPSSSMPMLSSFDQVTPEMTSSVSLSSSLLSTTPTLSTPSTIPPESPLPTVPMEEQLMIALNVDENIDVQTSEFQQELSYDLEELYIEGKQDVGTRRKRRALTRADHLASVERDEFLFHGLSSGISLNQNIQKREVDKIVPNRLRRKRRQTDDPNANIEVVLTSVTRDGTVVGVIYYVVEDNTAVSAETALNTFNQLNQSDYDTILPYEVVELPSYAVPPVTTPTKEPHASHDNQLVMLMNVKMDEEPVIDDLENKLEVLYIRAEVKDRRRKKRTISVDTTFAKPSFTTFLVEGKVHSRMRRNAEDPSESEEVYITDSRRTTNTPEEVYVQFFVYSNNAVVDGPEALKTYERLTTEEISAELGYEVLSITLLIEPTNSLPFWIALGIIIPLIILLIAMTIYFFCKKRTGKTEITSLDTIDRAVSALELGGYKINVDRGKIITSETSFNGPRIITSKYRDRNGKHSRSVQIRDSDLEEDVPVKSMPSRKRNGKVHPSSSNASATSETSYTEMDQPLFSHVRKPRALPPAPAAYPQNRSRFKNSVGVQNSLSLPPLTAKPLVADYNSDTESHTKKQLMSQAGVPKSWYRTHLYLNMEELQYEINKWTKRREQRAKRKEKKKSRKLMEEMERQREDRERAQRELDSSAADESAEDEIDALFEEQKAAATNPTARNERNSRRNRWKTEEDEASSPQPIVKKKKKKNKFVVPSNDGNVEMISSRSLGSPPLTIPRSSSQFPPYDQTPKHPRTHRNPAKIEEQPLQMYDASAMFAVPSMPGAYYQHVEDEESIQRKWVAERQRLNQMLDEVFAISSTVQDPRHTNHMHDSHRYDASTPHNQPPYYNHSYSPPTVYRDKEFGFPKSYGPDRYVHELDRLPSQYNSLPRKRDGSPSRDSRYPYHQLDHGTMPSNRRDDKGRRDTRQDDMQEELTARLREIGQANTLVYDKNPGRVTGRSKRKVTPNSDEGSSRSFDAWKNSEGQNDTPYKALKETDVNRSSGVPPAAYELDELKKKNKELQRQVKEQRSNVEKTLAEVGQDAKVGTGEPSLSAARQSESQQKPEAPDLSALARLRKTIDEWTTKDTPQETSITSVQQDKVQTQKTKDTDQQAQLSPALRSKGMVLEESQQQTDTDSTVDQGSNASLIPGQISSEDSKPTEKTKKKPIDGSNVDEEKEEDDSALSKLWNFVSSPLK